MAHFWDQILGTYRALKDALAPHATEVLGHFSHVYPQGTSLYLILLGEVAGAAEAEAQLGKIWDTAMSIALEQGAAISHHRRRRGGAPPYIAEALGSGMVVLERIKQALDPLGVMNPGKLGSEQATGSADGNQEARRCLAVRARDRRGTTGTRAVIVDRASAIKGQAYRESPVQPRAGSSRARSR